MGSSNLGERLTEEILDHFGIAWERIAEETERRADYRAKDDQCSYLLEVKEREDDPAYEAALTEHGHAMSAHPAGRTNRVSHIITSAADQLESTPAADDVVRLIVLVAAGHDAEAQERQFIGTAYGAVDLLTDMVDGVAQAKPCFYLTFNEFFRVPHVDGILTVLAQHGACRLFVNTFSSRREILKRGQLYQELDKVGAVRDPFTMEAAGEAFIADCDIDRKNRAAVLDYVTKKYSLPSTVIAFEPTQYKAGVVVPRRPE